MSYHLIMHACACFYLYLCDAHMNTCMSQVYSRSEKPADNEEVWASGGALGGDKVSALAGTVWHSRVQ